MKDALKELSPAMDKQRIGRILLGHLLLRTYSFLEVGTPLKEAGFSQLKLTQLSNALGKVEKVLHDGEYGVSLWNMQFRFALSSQERLQQKDISLHFNGPNTKKDKMFYGCIIITTNMLWSRALGIGDVKMVYIDDGDKCQEVDLTKE